MSVHAKFVSSGNSPPASVSILTSCLSSHALLISHDNPSKAFVTQYRLQASSHLCFATPSFSCIPAADSNLRTTRCRLVKVSHASMSSAASRQDTEGLVPVAEEQGLDLRLGMMRLSDVEACDSVEVLECKL